eukprot:1195362-Prorocentrum_minimum.AAC.1
MSTPFLSDVSPFLRLLLLLYAMISQYCAMRGPSQPTSKPNDTKTKTLKAHLFAIAGIAAVPTGVTPVVVVVIVVVVVTFPALLVAAPILLLPALAARAPLPVAAPTRGPPHPLSK